MVTNGDGAVQSNVLIKMNLKEVSSLAEQFVLQYYTVMNRCPEFLHRFYSNESVLIYESQPVTGQADINSLFTKLNLKDTHVLILSVDALKGHGNSAMVQVCGEQSVTSGPYRRFMRSFTLVERGPNSFAVIGDIFRYQDRVYIPEKKQSGNSTEAEAKQTVSKQSAKAPSNGVPVDSKNSNRHKPTEPKTEKQLSKKAEADQHPRSTSPKVPAEPTPRKPAESNLHSQVAPFKQEHVEPSASAQNKPQNQQNTSAQQQQATEQLEKSTSNAPMSYAQRASSNTPSTPPARAIHLNKTVTSEQPVKSSTKVGGSAQQRHIRGGGINNSDSLSSGRPNNQLQPQQAGPSVNRESNSEFSDNTHGQAQQVQHGGRSGFSGPRVNMRGAGGNRGGNRSSGRGGNRGANNSHAALPRQ